MYILHKAKTGLDRSHLMKMHGFLNLMLCNAARNCSNVLVIGSCRRIKWKSMFGVFGAIESRLEIWEQTLLNILDKESSIWLLGLPLNVQY